MGTKQSQVVEIIDRVISEIGRTPFAAVREEVFRRLPQDGVSEWKEFDWELDQLIYDALYPLVEFEWPLFQRATEEVLGHPVRVDSTDSDNHEIYVLKKGDQRAERVFHAAVRLAPKELFDDPDAFGVFLTEIKTRIGEYFVDEEEMDDYRRNRVRAV